MAYSEVRENLNGNGYNTYKFSIEAPAAISNPDSYPFANPPFYNLNGKQIEKKSFNQANTEVYFNATEPDNASSQYTESPGLMYKTHVRRGACAPNPLCPQCNMEDLILVRSYKHRTSAYRIKQIGETKDGIYTATLFTYDPLNRHLSPISLSYTNSDQKAQRTEHKYAFDLAAGALRDSLLARNMIGSPLETITKVGAALTTTGGSKTEYAFFDRATGLPTAAGPGTDPRPHKFHEFEMTYANGNTGPSTFGWTQKGIIKEYHGTNSSNTFGKGKPKKFVQTCGTVETCWKPEYYEWEKGGLIKKKTYNDTTASYHNFVTQYQYIADTRLVSKVTGVDGQFVDHTSDPLMRLSTVTARGGNAKTFYQYRYRNGTTVPRSFVRDSTVFTDMTASGSAFKEKVVFNYLDGLSRTIQTVDKKHSPNSKDVVAVATYDNQGRASRVYEPFEQNQANGASWPPCRAAPPSP
ncbi:MAG: hypothetical protein IPN76_07435 [Saprospiraceae bacterium]|nr:hypothetical protein [Saprospiraceae bacterium]